MIAIVNIINHDKFMAVELGAGTEAELKKRIPAEYEFICWNKDASEDVVKKLRTDLPVKVIYG